MTAAGRPERQIRSYHRAFHFELTLYSLGNVRLIKPVPARAILYFAAIEAAMVLAGRTPLLDALPSSDRAVMLYLIIPVGLSYVLTVSKIEGRRFHAALRVWFHYWLAPKRLAGAYRPISRPGRQWRPTDIVFISDGRCGRIAHRLSLKGPGKVGLRYPCEAHQQGKLLTVRQVSGNPRPEPKLLAIAPGATVRFVDARRPTR